MHVKRMWSGHLSPSTINLFVAGEIWCAPHVYGWFVFVDDGVSAGDGKFPPSFVKLLELARLEKAEWLFFYDNEEPEKGLPSWEHDARSVTLEQQ